MASLRIRDAGVLICAHSACVHPLHHATKTGREPECAKDLHKSVRDWAGVCSCPKCGTEVELYDATAYSTDTDMPHIASPR